MTNLFNKRTQVRMHQDGFTMMEILIVIALIAMVAGFVGPKVMSKFERGKVDTTKIQMRQIGVSLDDFKRECGFYPLTDQGLNALITKPTGGRECKNYDPEGYIKGKQPPKDGFGNDFVYTSDGAKYELKSLGADGAEGGDGNNKDILSSELE